jgi:hypothetical protein
MHGERVHHPGHRLRPGVHVGRGNVLLRAEQDGDFRGVTPREALALAVAQAAWIDVHAAEGAAERDLDEGRLPGVEHGQRPDLVEIEVRHEPNATARRPAIDVVMDTVAGVDLDPTVVVGDGEVHRQLALRAAQDAVHAGVEVEPLRGRVELAAGVRPDTAGADGVGSVRRHRG